LSSAHRELEKYLDIYSGKVTRGRVLRTALWIVHKLWRRAFVERDNIQTMKKANRALIQVSTSFLMVK